MRELRERHDDCHDARRDRAEAVEQPRCSPAGLLFPLPAHHHAELRERERGEDADGVERNQPLRLASEQRQHRQREHAERHDPERVGEAVAAERELARHEAVARHEIRQAREVGVGGVCRQHEDRHRRELHGVVGDVRPAENAPRDLRDHRLVSRFRLVHRHRAVLMGEEGDPAKRHREDADHPRQRRAGIAPFRWAERRDAVGDRLDTGQRRAAGGERAQDQEDPDRATPDHGLARWLVHIEAARGVAHDPQRQHRHHCDEEKVGRDREDRAGFADTAQIEHRNKKNEQRAGDHKVLVQAGERRDHGRDRR